MINSIAKLKHIWTVWNLRGFILFSFSLQCILIFGSSLRIQTSRTWVHRLIWLVYLLADWAAYYAIGLVVPVDRLQDEHTSDIHAFWAPFLLLHIGGPNTIAGFSLEDNELWDRSVLHIIVQAGATGIAIYRSLSKQQLLAPTLLVFVAAFTRYVGRILALSKGSLDDLRDSIINERVEPPLAEDVESITIPIKGDGSMTIPKEGKVVEPVKLVAHSYNSFQKYKGVFCGLSIRADKEVLENREELYNLKPYQAFTEMEIELSLAYDLFYTKIWTIIENKIGKILHLISLSSEVGALVFWVFANKNGYQKVDVKLTNILLIGGIALDVASILKLTFSDLVIYHLSKCCPGSQVLACALNKVLSVKDKNQAKCLVLFHRWSGTIKQFSLIMYEECCSSCIVKSLHRITGYEKGVSRVKLTIGMKNYIFKSIRTRALLWHSKNEKLEKQRSLLGEYILKMYDERELLANAMQQICKRLGVVDALLVFHIATHFFYSKEKRQERNQGGAPILRHFNIHISEYLMYLLFHQPKMMLEGAELDMTMEDMTKHLKQIKEDIAKDQSFEYVPIGGDREVDLRKWQDEEAAQLKTQEEHLGNVFKKVKGDEGITIHLISELASYIVSILRLGEHSEDIMSDMWMDFLLYAAIHCRARTHVQQLGNGGQLLTIVWLMMTHLGLDIKLPV